MFGDVRFQKYVKKLCKFWVFIRDFQKKVINNLILQLF
jgi:hypothetical protein